MTKCRRLSAVALLLVAAGVVDFVLFAQLEEGAPFLLRGWRLFLTLVLAVFLALGKKTARNIAVIYGIVVALATAVALSLVLLKGAHTRMSGAFLGWLALSVLLYAAAAAFLALSPKVSREIRRAAGKI